MSTRTSVVFAALLAGAALPALAAGNSGPLGGGEATIFPEPSVSGTVTRDEVVRQRDAWIGDPVTASGWKEVGGEAGWIYVGSDRALDPRQRTVAVPTPDDGWRHVGGEAGWIYVGAAQRAGYAVNAR
jgi:hypothetical protein